MSERVCRRCRRILTYEVLEERESKRRALVRCSYCNSDRIASSFRGMVVILDYKRSEIAKLMNISENGFYAVEVGR